jgi:signal transduction histidine kinase/CheY-like chemotaxis protein
MLNGYYEPSLVLVSLLVAVIASYTALSLAERVGHATGAAALWWVAGGAFAMGTGIWSMHFIGMLAFRLPIPLGYDLGITLLSWALPIAVSALALSLLSRWNVRWSELAAATVLLGLGINAMHYVGMAAMRMDPGIVYDPAWVAASVAIAIAAAGTALLIGFRLRSTSSPRAWSYRAGASVAMGLAIVGMHYTGMEAADFPVGSICRAATGGFTSTQLATLVIVGTGGVLAITLLTAVYDARLEARNAVLALSQQTARERQVLLDRERELRVEAERLSELKDQFLATLSHELRTPLSAVLGWTQILRRKHDEATVERGIETIERNARLQSKLIDDLLDTSLIVSGRVRIEPETVDPAALLGSAVETMRPAAALKSIHLQCSSDARGCMVNADPGRLQQVLWNLLSNAMKFTPEGGSVHVDLTCPDGRVQYRVADTGMGIDPDLLPYVFDRFFQADASTTRRHGGLGLGLAIVRELVELHGGEVLAESAGVGHGSAFTVCIPAARPAEQDRIGALAPTVDRGVPSRSHEADLKGVHVLVVDDESDARDMLQQLLGDRGASVRTADSARAALQALREEGADVLVSDIGMPETDGFGLIRQIRSNPERRIAVTKAIALSAFTRVEDRERALREGFDAYLPKPVDADDLVRSVASLQPPAAAERSSPRFGRQ